jgi:uncharacterized protein YigE (DUF2233 family)
LFVTCSDSENNDALIVSYTVDPAKQNIAFYWKDENGRILKSLQQLKAFVEQKNLKLNFAMNGGMFNADFSPKGLYIENNILLTSLDTGKGEVIFIFNLMVSSISPMIIRLWLAKLKIILSKQM